MFYQPFYALVKDKSGYKFGEKIAIGAVNLISSSITGVYKTLNKVLTIIDFFPLITLFLSEDFRYSNEIAEQCDTS